MVSRSALTELAKLEDTIKDEAVEAIAELREDPFPPGAIPLRGSINRYRIKFYRNRYRIIYQVSVKQHRVIVTRVRHRSSAYLGY